MTSRAASHLHDAPVPDAVLPTQLFSAAPPDTGARRLMLGVLTDAIDRLRLVMREGGRQRRAAVEARAWFASTARSHPFAFEAICDALDLDAGAIRRWVLAWGGDAPAVATAPPRRLGRRRVQRRRPLGATAA